MAEENIIEETRKRLEKYCKRLEGISHNDWFKLKMAMDRYFDIKISQLERELKLTELDLIPQACRVI